MSTINTTPVGIGRLQFHMLPSGYIHKINYEQKMINQLRGTNLDGQASNLYLRIHTNGGYQSKRLLHHSMRITHDKNHVKYEGIVFGLDVTVVLTITEQTWFYTVNVTNPLDEDIIYDVFYVQDIGIKHEGAIRNNEAYNSQYIDHSVYPSPNGYAICSLQNQGAKEYLQLGSLTPVIGYATDGYQFYGLSYKTTNIPEALLHDHLPNEVYQFEHACGSLQTAKHLLVPKDTIQDVFYGHFVNRYHDRVTNLEYVDEIAERYNSVSHQLQEPKELGITYYESLDHVYASPAISIDDIEQLYPNQIQEEWIEGQLVSFFDRDGAHIVLGEKEHHVERSHGHILLNGNNQYVREDVYASTNYIYGLFSSQVVIGNTSFNRFISNARNGLNIAKTSGQRILIKRHGEYQLLTMPAVYEMGYNYAKWLYKIDDDMLTITSYIGLDGAWLNLTIVSEKMRQYEIAVLHQVVMGSEEFGQPFHKEIHDNVCTFTLDEHSFTYQKYPELTYDLIVDAETVVFTDESFFIEPASYEAQTIVLASGHSMRITIQARLNHSSLVTKVGSFSAEKQRFIEHYNDLSRNMRLSLPTDHHEYHNVEKMNLLIRWYWHDALIHYASPHGLEQYGGAAWGTRDVCQGPFELFFAAGHYDVLRHMLLKIFSHQHLETGSWPQWFMFDRYSSIQAGDAHGDIIVWPLRSLALYLQATGDVSILEEHVPYTTKNGFTFTTETSSLFEHVKTEVQYIEDNLIEGTALSCYGDGDWDDTLQPANPELRKKMVSGWTTALTYEAFTLFAETIKTVDSDYTNYLQEFAKNIKMDYNRYVIKDQVPAGFLYIDEGQITYMIHPDDDVTNMKYRLLPMNRGIIGEMFDQEQAQHMNQLILNHLTHPDGVRLMNRTIPYKGGLNTYFKRAETSACFGREIGLQYVHAHIRYIEAMAKFGNKEAAYNGLFKINPINITDTVSNAMPRQANAYFSSSDGHFLTRYQAMDEFDKLYTGDIGVKGGWRVYSSGPGIYLNQLIGSTLGIRETQNSLQFDPQIPSDLDGLEVTYQSQQATFTLKYHLQAEDYSITSVYLNGQEVPFTRLQNPYRMGGIAIDKELFNDGKKDYIIDLYTM
ncbi:GH36-type glycosyl hydrolase domain-containing protein [Candidatus Xianfuyuplasma coldseepsis]|uniref:Cellobiose phosphorylase n=1 Tax=Candidatus Xianfuyuplasma coldseepsis TaxID=2782163 RepID=A0A7L7KQH7_9MOLU|nr:cellobiose phosphorylase [Xianfuyuplasma coldseepsis]QMS85060.1 cellobiose phosphorylase [Xianfuyuplasma coldseepsis]